MSETESLQCLCEDGFPRSFLTYSGGVTVEEGSQLGFVCCFAGFVWIEHSNNCFKCFRFGDSGEQFAAQSCELCPDCVTQIRNIRALSNPTLLTYQ